ncbi:MAG: hypothetical protein HYW77_03615 [Parcubacteria group bacterium]|nr:hypothetical protein [Parcubacteria group bacterium]
MNKGKDLKELGNTVGNHGSLYLGVNNHAVRKLRQELKLSDEQRSLIYGTMLGDGTIYGNQCYKPKNYRLQINHSSHQKDLVFWKYERLKNFVLKDPKYVPSNHSWRFRTISHPELTEIHGLFYKNGKKVLPQNIESIIGDRLALAVWYMDDGCKWVSKLKEVGLILNTQSFTHKEVKMIAGTFRRIYNFDLRIHRDHGKFRVHIPLKDQKYFSNLISKFTIDTLKYKLPR